MMVPVVTVLAQWNVMIQKQIHGLRWLICLVVEVEQVHDSFYGLAYVIVAYVAVL